jgi:hypothetical protein
MSDEAKLHAYLLAQGYRNIKRLQNGELAATQRMLYTTGVVVGLTQIGYDRRFCYDLEPEAVSALLVWEGVGDPPGPWIKEKPSDRLGPGATA